MGDKCNRLLVASLVIIHCIYTSLLMIYSMEGVLCKSLPEAADANSLLLHGFASTRPQFCRYLTPSHLTGDTKSHEVQTGDKIEIMDKLG